MSCFIICEKILWLKPYKVGDIYNPGLKPWIDEATGSWFNQRIYMVRKAD